MTHFPRHPVPTGRIYKAGDYSHGTYRAMSGAEVRILFGNKRLASTVQLIYKNIPDKDAEDLLDHYNSVKGTFESFEAGGATLNAGWTATTGALNTTVMVTDTEWRYAQPPQLQSVYIGLSSVTVDLVAVTV